MGIQIETFFGFFAQAVFTAMAGYLSRQTGQKVSLEQVSVSATNSLKLREKGVETVLLPRFAEPVELAFVLALTPADVSPLSALAQERMPLKRLLEQMVASAVEPFNFVCKVRNRLQSLQVSTNLTGLAASHLDGEMAFTMAHGRMRVDGRSEFGLRLLVTHGGRDAIEDRAAQPNTQRALFSINEGAYICQPQWEPPPPPAGMEKGTGLTSANLSAWISAFFVLNSGKIPPKVFQQPAQVLAEVSGPEKINRLPELAVAGKEGASAGEGAPPKAESFALLRLVLQGGAQPGGEVMVLVPPQAEKSLMSLSRSGDPKFLGEFFRALFSEAAGLWERFSGVPTRWQVKGMGRIPAEGLDKVAQRLKGGGLLVRQEIRLDEGRVQWWLAVTPHAWLGVLTRTAQAMGMAVEGVPERTRVFEAAGWAGDRLPWVRLLAMVNDGELRDITRLLQQHGLAEPHMAAVIAGLEGDERSRWLESLPVMLRERSEAYELAEGEGGAREKAVAGALLAQSRAGKLPPGRLADWFVLYGEAVWARRQTAINRLLPLRHLVYGLDRNSLSRLLFDLKNDQLADVVSGAEFTVVDQMRRAISPGYAVRLLEDVAVRRPRTSALMFQEALLTLYQKCQEGAGEGRYMVRATAAQRLDQLLRWLEEPS